MKPLRIALLLSAIMTVAVWSFLALVVPPWIYPYVSRPTPLPNHLKVLLPFSNHARTPLGIIVVLSFVVFLILIYLSQKKR